MFSFSNEHEFRYASRLTFISGDELEFQLCEWSLAEAQARRGEIRCSGPAWPKRMRIPSPLVAGRAE
jgi:hypothetical protein